MKNKKIAAVMLPLALVLGLAFLSCSTSSGFGPQRVDWAEYTIIPGKDYTVVGAVVVRITDSKTLNADLMQEAIKLGGHDIINVRVDVEQSGMGEKKVLAATAVAIKYTAETLKTKEGEYLLSKGGSGSGNSGGSGNSVSSGAQPEKKKFLGLF